MTTPTHFKSDRAGASYVSDGSGSRHARFLHLTSYALMPLGLVAAWLLSGLAGQPLEAARAQLARPLSALALVAFAVIAMAHARQGMDEIIEDYLHDPALRKTALLANRAIAVGVSAIWTISILLIAAGK